MLILKFHKCDVCGKIAPWSESWSWHGSLLSQEAGEIVEVCSQKCQTEANIDEIFERKFGHPFAPANYVYV